MQLWSVALVAIRSLRNFELFKIPCDDFSTAVRSVCRRSALAQLVLWSQYDRPWSRCYCTRSALDLRSHECTATALRLFGPYCDHKTSVLRTRSQSVSLSRSTVAIYSLYSLSTVGRFAFRVECKNTAIRCDLCFGVTARRRLSGDQAATYDDRRRFEVAVVAVRRTRCDSSIK